ncbi:MAG: hypothetical protein EA424_21980 [Planctomycetaceae bacterium]|nr:MAG: hypothetical protein EA424_21980 [Planctomycetaceae bacterium]
MSIEPTVVQELFLRLIELPPADRSAALERETGSDALVREIQRYLANEPVEARPQSAGYRIQKFVRRHKGPVLGASLVALALMVGVLGTTSGMIRAWNAASETAKRSTSLRWSSNGPRMRFSR